MLANLERAYLGILRVIILIFATIALIITFISFIGAAPELLRWSGLSQPAKPSGGTLAGFIAEQKAVNSGAAGVASGTDTTPSAAYILPAIKDAVANLSRYPGLNVDSTIASQKFQHEADSFHERSAEYADSLKALTEELVHSTGQPLSRDRVLTLIDWHDNQFMADVASKETEKATQMAGMTAKIGLAAGAFIAFIMMIFVFIFVKIERNLRVLQFIAPEEVEHE